MSVGQINVRSWLIENNYPEVVAKIDRVMAKWDKQNKRTRRNWWDVLAGTKDGKPQKIEGVMFPVLRAARLRKGWDPTPNCLCKNANEVFLPVVEQPRWANREVTTKSAGRAVESVS